MCPLITRLAGEFVSKRAAEPSKDLAELLKNSAELLKT